MNIQRKSLIAILLLLFVSGARPQTTPRVCVKHLVSPAYPPLARQARLQGILTANLHIRSDGTVRDVTVSTDEPLLRDHPLLQSEIQRVVRQWTFECIGCASAEFEHSVRFTYLLDGEDSDQRNQTVAMDLPNEITISDTPPLCDHCPTKPRSKR
jgi:Gram-negative bacterial TonB protein C-terminal